MPTSLSFSRGEGVSLYTGLPRPGGEWWGQCESIFPPLLSVSFLMPVLPPDALLPHLESLAHMNIFSCVDYCSNLNFWEQGNKCWKFLCCPFADITLISAFTFEDTFVLPLTSFFKTIFIVPKTYMSKQF